MFNWRESDSVNINLKKQLINYIENLLKIYL